MRALKFILFFLITNSSFAQSALDTKYAADVCACLDSLKITGLDEQNFTECFQKAVFKNSGLVLQETREKYGDTSEANGYKFGKELAERTMISLVGDCKTYFILMDSLRYEDYNNLNKDSLELQLKSLNKTEATSRNDEFYSEKALLFFELKNYDSSLFVIEQSLALEPNNFQNIFIKAWIMKLKEITTRLLPCIIKQPNYQTFPAFIFFQKLLKERKIVSNSIYHNIKFEIKTHRYFLLHKSLQC